jgi:hypothetical protein
MFEEASRALDAALSRGTDFRTYVQVQRSHPMALGNDLHSLLIKPIQRLPRYKLLLEQLYKTCSHAAEFGGCGGDAAAAAAAAAADSVNLVDEATIFINERKRDAGQSLALRFCRSRFQLTSVRAQSISASCVK